MIKFILILLLLVVLGGAAYYFTRRKNGDESKKFSKKPMNVTFYDKPGCTGNVVNEAGGTNILLDSSFNLKPGANQPKACCMKVENTKILQGWVKDKNNKVILSFNEHPFSEAVIDIKGCSNDYNFNVAPLE